MSQAPPQSPCPHNLTATVCRSTLPGYLLVVAASILWASAGVASGFAPAGTSAAAIADARMLRGGLALAVALGPGRLIRSMALLPRRHLIWASAAMALFQWSFFGAVAKAGATTATLVSAAAAPLAAGAIAAAQRRCWPRGGWWSALGVASSGVSLVTTHGPNSAAAAGSAGGDRNGFPGGVGVAAHCRFLTTLSQRTGGAGLTQHGPGPPRFIHCCLSTRRNTCRTQHTAP
jgi:drug/metabolite transporter (DMT)-like permease